MRVWIVYHYESVMMGTRRFSIDRFIESAAELEDFYQHATEWCDKRNKELIYGKWSWTVELGENQEGSVNAMLLLQIFEIVEDVVKFWEENGQQAKGYEV